MTRPMPVRALSIVAMTILVGMSFGGSSYAEPENFQGLEDSCEVEGTDFCFFNCDAGEFITAKSDNGPGVTIADCGGTGTAAVSFFAPRETTSLTPARIAGSGMCTHIGTSSTGECSSGT